MTHGKHRSRNAYDEQDLIKKKTGNRRKERRYHDQQSSISRTIDEGPRIAEDSEWLIGRVFYCSMQPAFQTEGQPEADFINTVVWNKTADSVAKYTHKGSLVGVEGRIQTRNYDDKDGKRVYVTEVVADNVRFLDSRNAGDTNSAYVPEQEIPQSSEQTSNTYQSFSSDFTSNDTLDIADEDLPF